MEYVKLILVLFSATGFWKLIEILIKYRYDKKVKIAEERTLHAQAESQIVGNWIQWSQTLERRVKEVADENLEMVNLIKKQQERITELEQKVKQLVKENLLLHEEIKRLTQ
jgi:hypothetical protein